MTLDLGTWPLTSLTYKGTLIASLTQVWFQSDFNFSKETPNNKNQHFPPNLTSDDPWPWYVTFDLINIQRNPYCILDPSLVVIGLQLFKGDPNNKNPTKLEHVYTYIHQHTEGMRYCKIPSLLFKPQRLIFITLFVAIFSNTCNICMSSNKKLQYNKLWIHNQLSDARKHTNSCFGLLPPD